MKQKKSQDSLTKDVLKTEIKGLEERLGKKFVTQGFFSYEMDKTKQEVDEKARSYRDEILTSNDRLAKTLETIREDLEIGNFQMGEKIEDHERRIKNVEKVQQTA